MKDPTPHGGEPASVLSYVATINYGPFVPSRIALDEEAKWVYTAIAMLNANGGIGTATPYKVQKSLRDSIEAAARAPPAVGEEHIERMVNIGTAALSNLVRILQRLCARDLIRVERGRRPRTWVDCNT